MSHTLRVLLQPSSLRTTITSRNTFARYSRSHRSAPGVPIRISRTRSWCMLASSGVIKLGAVCRSPDGQQLLVLNHGRFYHCNLKTKAVKQWQAPEALAKANVELHAVAVR